MIQVLRIFKNFNRTLLVVGLLFFMGGCQEPDSWDITVVNNSDFTRLSETVTIPLEKLGFKVENIDKSFLIKDNSSSTYGRTQLLDQNEDGSMDVLIFQVNIDPLSEKSFELIIEKNVKLLPDNKVSTYSRFVPERVDDYTWENDRVAFRTYGPEAERLVKDKETGGTLSSGIDCWLKRVDYPVINKWYKMEAEGDGSYHVDHGEGLDNYHVGSSRGCGGIGIWKDDMLYSSDNFTAYKTLAVGPIRTSFILEYAPWDAGTMVVNEKKYISLDLGSNLSKIEVQFDAPYPQEIVAGLAIPEYDGGRVNSNPKSGWFSYWSGHDGSELGMGIVADPKFVIGYNEHRVSEAEKSHLFVRLRPINGKVTYYTGFGWKKRGQFKNMESWNNYLSQVSMRLASPLEIIIE